MQVVNESVYLKKVFFRPFVPLETEATYTSPRPLKIGLEVEARPRGLTSLLLSQCWLALEVRAPLNPVLVTCHRFKRTQADPLWLSKIFSEYALSWPACPTSHQSPELNLGPLEAWRPDRPCALQCSDLCHCTTRAGYLAPPRCTKCNSHPSMESVPITIFLYNAVLRSPLKG